MTKGILSSEFWLTVVGALIAPGGFLYILKDQLAGWPLGATVLGWVITLAAAIISYIKSRTDIKVNSGQ